MSDISCDLLSLTSEPALKAHGGVISFANTAALRLLGGKCVGREAAEIFGADLCAETSGGCVGGAVIDGKDYVVRMNPVDGGQVFFLSEQTGSHDMANQAFLYSLRSSMSALSLVSEQLAELAEELNEPAIYPIMQTLSRSYYKIRRSVNNLTLAQAAEGALPCSPKEFDLGELCAATLDTLALLCKGEHFDFSCQGSALVKADPELSELLLLNLLSNAMRHAKKHSLIRVTLRRSGSYVLLLVSDDGCGIAPELLPQVFSRYRYGFEHSELAGGAGFGLYVSLHIAMRQGGTLMLKSRENEGTTVCVSFPALDTKRSGDLFPLTFKMENLLTGLADCLPEECFGVKYAD